MIRGARHSQAWALHRSTGCQPVCLPGSRGGLLRSTGCQPVCRSGLQWARDCPCHLAGRSLRADQSAGGGSVPGPPLTRRKPRFALQASLGFLRRSIGTGSPSQPLVAQVFNLCVFPFRSALLRVPPAACSPFLNHIRGMMLRGAARAREPGSAASEATTNPPAADRCPAKRSRRAASGGPEPAASVRRRARAAPSLVNSRGSRVTRTSLATPSAGRHRGLRGLVVAIMMAAATIACGAEVDPAVLEAQQARIDAIRRATPATVSIFAGESGGGSGVLLTRDGICLP